MSLYSKIIDIQKLQAAWRNVNKNKPARGVDDIHDFLIQYSAVLILHGYYYQTFPR